MNDPWNTLVEVLAGRQRPAPSSWSQRRVHRMCDDLPSGRPVPRAPAPPAVAGLPGPGTAKHLRLERTA